MNGVQKMNNLVRCEICSGISEYNINLMRVNLIREKEDIPKTIGIGIDMNFENLELLENNICKSKVSTSIICVKPDNLAQTKGPKDVKQEDIYFQLDFEHSVTIELDKKLKIDIEDEETVKSIKHYSWFVLYPTLRDSVNSLTSKIGVPNINIPYGISKSPHES